MLSTALRRSIAAAVLVTAAALAGCAAGGGGKVAAPAGAPSAQADGPIGLSPAGVTTRIDIPAQSTEEQYAQSCMTTKEWMGAKGGDPDTLVEPYLKELQASTSPGPATFNKTWADLTEAQRAAVIVAVRAAADGGC